MGDCFWKNALKAMMKISYYRFWKNVLKAMMKISYYRFNGKILFTICPENNAHLHEIGIYKTRT